jgi:membrane fusion protein (multidrug efflux system)
MRNRNPSAPALTASALAVVLLIAGCGKDGEVAAPRQMPPPEVAVRVVEPQKVSITTELPGRTSAYLVAEVRPQVGGILQKRLFTEGSDVRAGELLYQIDPSTYQAVYDNAVATQARARANLANAKAARTNAAAALASAKAALARAEANAVPLRLKADRYRELLAINAVSKQDADDTAAAVQQADATIQGAEATVKGAEAQIEGAEAAVKAAEADIAGTDAALETARINLAHTRVTAPIAGRIGRSAVTVGALVTANQAVALATIQQLDPVYVDVTQSAASLLRLEKSLANGELRKDGAGQARVKLVLEDGSPYPLAGTLKFSDVTVEPSTGSVTLRTVFPNPQHLLLPGMYVRAVVEEGTNDQAILVPQRGVTRDPAGRPLVMVVGDGEKVEPRIIQTERTVGDDWLVTEGLKPGDRVILEGLQRARPGTVVKPVPFDSEAQAPSGAAASPADKS